MFPANQKSTGTCYTTTVTLLVIALVFCPALIAFVRPLGNYAVGMIVSTGGACLVMAWLSWRRYSRLTMPSLEN